MTAANISSFLTNMRKKAKSEGKKLGKRILYTATFINGRSYRKVLVKMDALEIVSQVNVQLAIEKPEKVKIDMFTDAGEYVDMNVCEVVDNIPQVNQPIQFKGFGEAEINQIVDQRFSERQRLIEHEELKEEVKLLTSENEELENRIEELENRNAELETEIETKKSIKYYAGMLGDILESFGIEKKKIKKPIAEFMGITDGNEAPQKQLPAKTTDNSGIVEETPAPQKPSESNAVASEEQKKDELINLITDYLKSTSLLVVAKLFHIFSDIEANNAVADELMEYLQKRKEFSHDNI
jgi:cell division septum initiation protein DivIVA